MSDKTLIEVFDEHFTQVKFDNKLAREIYKYQVGYVNRSKEHMEFFGSNLLGVHVVRFKDSDVLGFFNDVLDVDYQRLLKSVRELTTINHSFKVSSDLFNLTCMYVIHRFLEIEDRSETQDRALYDTALLFFYRCIAALLSDRFRYPADPKIAQQAYANLSNKYLIKKLGSWFRVMDYRANDLISSQSIHYANLKSFRDDTAIIYAISDSQGRIRDLVKNYYNEFKQVHESGEGIASTKSTYIDIDGEETIKEKTKSVESVVTYMRNIINDERSFIKDELVSVIASINNNTSARMVKLTLSWMSHHITDAKMGKNIDEFISMVVVQSLFFINNYIEPSRRKDLAHVLVTLKNLYLSTRTTDADIEKIRVLGESIVKTSRPGMSNSLILATRTSIILYISLRAIVGHSGGST